MPYINSIQLLRFVAASFVILSHLGIGEHSYKGIDILFVISGFVIYLTSYKKLGKGLRPGFIFLKRRLIRIFAFYWLLFFGLIGLGIYPAALDGELFKNVFLIPGHKSFLKTTWSLSYELYFYGIFFVLILSLSLKRANLALIMLWSITGLFVLLQLTAYSLKGHPINFLVGQNIWQILSGVLACMAYLKMGRWNTRKQKAMNLFLLSLGICLFLSYTAYYSTISFITAGIGSALIVLSLANLEGLLGLSIPVVFVKLGNASYVAYLIHIPILSYLLSDLNLENTAQPIVLMAIIGIWILSVLLHEFIEKKLLDKLNKMV